MGLSISGHNSIDHIGDPLASYVREDKMSIIQGTSIESINDEHNAFPETTANVLEQGGKAF